MLLKYCILYTYELYIQYIQYQYRGTIPVFNVCNKGHDRRKNSLFKSALSDNRNNTNIALAIYHRDKDNESIIMVMTIPPLFTSGKCGYVSAHSSNLD